MPRPSRASRPRKPSLDRLELRSLMAFAGGLDPGFGGTGTVLDPVAAGTTAGLSDLALARAEPDGSIIAAGPVGSSREVTFGLVRIAADGTPDTSFGVGGEADVPLPAGTTAYGGGPTSLLIQPDGSIVVVGQGLTGGTTPADASIVARFHADGTPDTSFGQGGVAVLDRANLGIGYAYLTQAALQGDGKIVLAGSSVVTTVGPFLSDQQVTVARLDANGTLDTGYGTGGVVNVSGLAAGDTSIYLDNPAGLAIDPQGRAVILSNMVGGNGRSHPFLTRLGTDGTPDASLGQAGLLASGLTAGGTGALIIQPDGEFLVEGNSGLARLEPNGSLDRVAPFAPNANLVPGKFALQSDGKVDLLAGDGSAIRLRADLTLDPTFGLAGVSRVAPPQPVPPPGGPAPNRVSFQALTLAPGDRVVLAGSNFFFSGMPAHEESATALGFARLTSTGTSARPGDYTGDGISDPAVYLPSTGTFVVKSSANGGVVSEQFGTPGLGASIPVPGNYYGSGKDDLAVYLVQSGSFAIKDSSGNTPGEIIQFGTPGLGNSIPVPGDFYGTGKDDLAVYLTQSGTFAIQDPTGKTPGKLVQFGTPGLNQSIPVPGDYYGTGRDDVAVYLTGPGVWAIQDPTGRTPGELVQFGKPGFGNSVPAPGDYDGSGKTELAVYLPALAELVYRPANGGPDVTIPFGAPGIGQTLIAPGDYSGDGKTDLAAYLPASGLFADRSAAGGAGSYVSLGTGSSVPAFPVTAVIPPPIIAVGPPLMAFAFAAPADPLAGLTDVGGPPAKKKAAAGTT